MIVYANMLPQLPADAAGSLSTAHPNPRAAATFDEGSEDAALYCRRVKMAKNLDGEAVVTRVVMEEARRYKAAVTSVGTLLSGLYEF